jgi:hypothetical protein
VPDHRASSVERRFWEHPLVDGAPARHWAVLAWGSLCCWLAAATLFVVLNFVAPQLMDVQSTVAVILEVVFVVGGVAAFVGFWRMFRQLDREITAGYTTLNWNSLSGFVPVVNPRTRLIRRGTTSRFDAVAARARAPWSSGGGIGAKCPPLSSNPQPSRSIAGARGAAIASTVLAVLAIWARAENGSVPVADTLSTGVVVIGAMVAAFLVTAFILRAVQTSRLAKVSRLASGIVVACYSTPEVRASSDRLGIGKGVIPWAPVLVFGSAGLVIWDGSGVPHPVVTISRNDITSLETTTIKSGRTWTIGLEVTVVPPDERWPFRMDFTVFDPSRLLAAANQQRLGGLIRSITDAWCSAQARE